MLGNIHRSDSITSARTMLTAGGLPLRGGITATLATKPTGSVARPMRKLRGRGTT